MKRHLPIGLLLLLALATYTPSVQAVEPVKSQVVEPVEGPALELSSIDSLMWQRPDSALMCLLPFFDTGCKDTRFCFSTATEHNRHYAHLLLAELLYKNDYAQTNRAELQQAVSYFDSLVRQAFPPFKGVPEGRGIHTNNSNDILSFLDARTHYINGVGYYENDSAVEACAEYLKALEIIEEHFGEKELVGHKAQFLPLIYTRLTDLYSDSYLHEQAIYFAHVSILYYQKTEVASWILSRMLLEIGIQYDMMNQLDSAQFYYQNAAYFSNDINSLMFRDITAHQLYLKYEIGEQADTVLSSLSYLLSIANDPEECMARMAEIGEIFYHEKQYDSAWIYLNMVFEESKRTDLKKQTAEWLVAICKAQCREEETHKYANFLVPFANQEENKSAVKSQLTEKYNTFRQNELEKKHIEEVRKNTKYILIIIGGLLVALLVVLFVHLWRKNSLKTQLEAESHAHEMKQKALSGRLKTSNEALRNTLKRLEEKEEKLKTIENNSIKHLDADNYEAFKQIPICQEIQNNVRKLYANKQKTPKTDMDVKEFKDFALSVSQTAQLSKTVETVFPNLHASLETIYPNLDRNDWLHCCLYLLQLDKMSICVLLQEPYYTCRRCTLKLEESFNCRRALAAFLIEQAESC
jgi:hypothetical protein